MSDLLIRKIPVPLKRKIKERARAHGRSMSAEAQALIKKGLNTPAPEVDLGDWLFNLVPPEYRGDDLVFEIPDAARKPPDFK
jgi:hypothetical protein